MVVDLFITCLNDALFPRTGVAMVKLLERLGHEVRFREEQTCCGQMHFNSGYRDEALPLIRRFVDMYRDAEVVVSPSGSCVAMVRGLYAKAAVWAGDSALSEEVAKLALRVFELSEFLVKKLEVEEVGACYPHRVAYHPTCHGLRTLKLGDAPLRLLRKVDGLELVELENPEECCGFGGTFSVKNPETSEAMMADKIAAFAASGAEVLCAVDNSCLMHLGCGMSRLQMPARTMHLAEILASTRGEVGGSN